MAESLKEALMRSGKTLKELRQPYEAHYAELGRNFLPWRTRFSKGDQHKSEKSMNRELINPRPRLSLRTLQSGMQGGMTSPARPWFKLLARDEARRRDATLIEHLSKAQAEMRLIMQSSGLYNALHTTWGDLGVFGTDCIILEDDLEHVIHPVTLVPGEYWLSANDKNLVDTVYREIEMTIHKIVSKFVYRGVKTATPDWSVVPNDIKERWDKGDYSVKREVCHMIAPRQNRDERSWLPKDKPVMSAYWLAGHVDGSEKRLMGNLGYDENPIIASRWDVVGENVYGNSPAMDVLQAARSLQVQERDYAEAVRRMNRPPMNAPTELRNSGYSLMPEAVNYMSDPTKGLVPAYQINPPLQHLSEKINETEDRIDEGLYANLFLMISRLQRREITAREIDERHEEKLISLGPVLERQNREKLGPVIRRVYERGIAAGRIPPLPPDYAEEPVKIDYISMLAQAQRAVATGGIERLYGFMGNLAASDQEVLDLVDNDMAVTEYAEMLGVEGKLMRDKDKVAERRAGRRQAMQAEAQIDQQARAAPAIKQTAEAAKLLAETDATGRPVDILRNLGLR